MSLLGGLLTPVLMRSDVDQYQSLFTYLAVLDAGYPIVGVVTGPDKPRGRGQKLSPTPVKEVALRHQLPLLQPESVKDPSFAGNVRAFEPDIAVVVAFRILPRAVFAVPRMGSFNLHASLLPRYRGAAPIQWAIINGETETGVTTFLLEDRVHIPAAVDSLAAGDVTGFAKIVTDPKGKLLGAAIVGVHAGELIAEYGLALARGLSAKDVSAVIHTYPTLASVNRRAADQRMKEGLTPTAKTWIRRIFRLQGR